MHHTQYPSLTKLAVDAIAKDVLRDYRSEPSSALSWDDYSPNALSCVGRTDWNAYTLATAATLVCGYTGYTRNQMLAAMLNHECRDSLQFPGYCNRSEM